MVEYGEITEAGARNDSAKDRLTRSIGMKCEPLADVRCIDLRPGDQILLCSDGLTKMLSDTELSDVFGLGLASGQICRRLVSAANKAGGADNVTVVHLGG